jgi:nitrogen fixation NifU-like protein
VIVFSETLLDHFQSPRNVGSMEAADAEGEDENPICGDRLHLWLRIDGDTIVEARWQAEGCAPAIAASSVASEMLRGMDIDSARRLDRTAVEEALGGLPPRKGHAAALVIAALHRALAGYTTDAD